MIEIAVWILTATWKKIKDATVVKNNSKAFTVFNLACTQTKTSLKDYWEGVKTESFFICTKFYIENIPEAKFFKIAFRCLRNIEVVIPMRTKLRIINNTKKCNEQMGQNWLLPGGWSIGSIWFKAKSFVEINMKKLIKIEFV